MTSLSNLYLSPLGEREIISLPAGMESIISSLYNIQRLLPHIDQSQTERTLTAEMQHANSELFAQCERISQIFENISVQAQAYKHLEMSQSKTSRAVYLQRTIEEAQSIIGGFEELITHQENITDYLLRRLSSPISALLLEVEPGRTWTPTSVTDFPGTVTHSLNHLIPALQSYASRRLWSLFDPFIRHRSHMSQISTQVEDAVGASNEVLQSLKTLLVYYTHYLKQLQSQAPAISTVSLNASAGSSQCDGSPHCDLKRIQESWTEYQKVILEAIVRLGIVADTIPRSLAVLPASYQLPPPPSPPTSSSDQTYFDPAPYSPIKKRRQNPGTSGCQNQQSTFPPKAGASGFHKSQRWSWSESGPHSPLGRVWVSLQVL